MQVSEDIFEFLSSQKLIGPNEGKKVGEDKYSIGKQTAISLENGQAFAKIARSISKQAAAISKRPEMPLSDLDSLKELNTPAARVYNWKIIADSFNLLEISLPPDLKSLIIAADQTAIFSFLRSIISATAALNDKPKNKQPKHEYKDEIDVSKLDIGKDLNRCKSCLEFFVVLLSRHLSLPVAQTASLFTHTNKYMAHLFAKGVKGLFDPIIEFYQEVYSNVPLLLQLFSLDPTKRNMHLTMNCLKPGLISKSLEVAQWSARLFSKLAFEFGDSNLLTTSWDWFVGENGGLSTTLLGLKRHPDLSDLVTSILLQFARYNFVELFSIHIKRSQPDPRDQINTTIALIKPLSESSAAVDELINSGIVDEWIEFAMESATDDYKNSPDLRIASLTLLFNLWMVFPFKFEDSEDRSNQVIALFNKACRDKSNSVVISSLTLLFQMLVYFGNQRSQFAPSIYRTLTLSVIENHANIVVREFAMRNFTSVFQQLESIPLNILVEPLVRQIQVTDNVTYFFNVFDLEFFEFVAKSDRLQLKNAIQVLDLFFKVYLNNSVFAHLSSIPIISIIERFSESETLHEFVIKFVKVSLAMFYASEKKKRPKDRIMPLYNNKNAMTTANLSPGEIEAELTSAQKRALIVEMIKRVVKINQRLLNDKICPLVAHTNIQIKQFSKSNSKGMMSILQLFGNPEQILEKYEKEYIEHQNALRQEEKDKDNMNNNDSLLDNISIEGANQADILKSIEDNLKKYQKLTKEEAMHLALLRNPKADPKVLKNLKDVKKNYNDREDKKKRDLSKQEGDLQKEKEVLRKQLMKRSLEQGVSNFNQKDMDGALLFQFGTKERQHRRETQTDIPIISYIDLDKEEHRDKEMINILLKKYQKFLKNVFVKYSNSGFSSQFSSKNLNSFDNIKEHSSTISVPEIYKFIKEYDLSDRLSKDEHQVSNIALVRVVAQESARNPKNEVPEPLAKRPLALQRGQLHSQGNIARPNNIGRMPPPPEVNMFEKGNLAKNHGITDLKDVKAFKFTAFQDYIVQFACFIYSKPPTDLRHLPLCSSLQALFDHLRESTKRKGQPTTLFDDQDTAYFGESEVIKEFNKKLEANPEYPLPQGYKKIKEKQLNFNYELKEDGPIQMKESFRFAYLILNDLFKEKLNFFLIEPKSVPKEVLKAVPLIGGPMEVESHYMDHFKTPQLLHNKKPKAIQPVSQSQIDIIGPWGKPDSTKTLPSTLNVKHKYGDKRVLEIDSVHKLDLGMKLAISSLPYKDRYTAEQVAYCLDDIIKAVENNKDSVGKKKVENLALKERKVIVEEEEEQKKKQNEKLKKNHEFVKNRAKEIEETNVEKKAEKREKEAQKRAEIEQLEKKKSDGVNNFWKEKKEVTEQLKAKKSEEAKRALEEKLAEEKAIRERKDKEFADFHRKQLEKQSEEYKRAREKDQKAEEDKKKSEEEQKQIKERRHQQIVKANQERIEIEKESHRKITELFKSEGVTKILKTNEFKLQQLFECLRKVTFRQISRQVINDGEIDFKTFAWFCSKFNFCPDVLANTQEIALIFRSLTRNKPILDHKPVGLNEEEFREALVRISVKGKKIFNKFAESLSKGINLNEEQMQDIADEENKDEPKQELDNRSVRTSKTDAMERMKNVIDDYGNIDEANPTTLEALIYYLGLPNDKIGINEALKMIIEAGAKPNQIRKKELKHKITQDPKELVRVNPLKANYRYAKNQINNNNSSIIDSRVNESVAPVEEEGEQDPDNA